MNRKTDRIRTSAVIVLLLIFAIAAWAGSFKIYLKSPGIADSGTYPLLMSSLMILCLLISLVQVLRQGKDDPENEARVGLGTLVLTALKEEFPPRTVFLMACIVGYGILFHFFGFYISTAVFLIVSMLGLFRGKKLPLVLGVTGISLVSVYVIIEKIFNIPLP